MDLPTMRTRVRRDLHDEVSAKYRWTDDELDRHIQHALNEVSAASPHELKAALTASPGSRDISIAAITGLLSVQAVEYPAGQYPPRYVRFSVWADTLKLLVPGEPTGGEAVDLYYIAYHVLDAVSSTLPASLEDVVADGAGAYAAIERSNFTINRSNAGGEEVWRRYLTWGQDRMASFLRRLAELGRNNAVRVRSLYLPEYPTPGQSTDRGP